VLVGDFVLVEEFSHFISDHVTVVGNRYEGDLFTGFSVLVAGLLFWGLGVLGGLRSTHSHQYTSINPD